MNTMVPCMRCGRSFCRICSPPEGGSHYCPGCSADLVRELVSKAEKRRTRPGRGKKKKTVSGRVAEKQASAITPSTVSTDQDSGGAPAKPAGGEMPYVKRAGRVVTALSPRQERDAWSRVPGFVLRPISWAGGSLKRAVSASTGRLKGLPPGKMVAEHQRRRDDERRERRVRKVRRWKRARGVLASWIAHVVASAESLARGIVERVYKAAVAAAWFIPKKMAALAVAARGRFPVVLVETDVPEDEPLYRERWGRLVLITVGGAALWVISVFVMKERWVLCGWLVGILVGIGFVWALEGRVSRDTGLLAAMAAVLSITVGELVVQLLFRLRVLKEIGITERLMARTYSAWGFYFNFFWWFVICLLLPAGLLAFLLGAWPFSRRPYWRGVQRY
ncbi:MAG: hypothetical protein KJ907_01605 [Actinobacteria bacterium]|nr:hypothetical protein [Actinomycetota bacterium]MBU4401420.1 hypothetical protein [Actinomycetota bacterium]MBU4442513.1 hypothetical protein [Actinomycetota bacterium]